MPFCNYADIVEKNKLECRKEEIPPVSLDLKTDDNNIIKTKIERWKKGGLSKRKYFNELEDIIFNFIEQEKIENPCLLISDDAKDLISNLGGFKEDQFAFAYRFSGIHDFGAIDDVKILCSPRIKNQINIINYQDFLTSNCKILWSAYNLENDYIYAFLKENTKVNIEIIDKEK